MLEPSLRAAFLARSKRTCPDDEASAYYLVRPLSYGQYEVRVYRYSPRAARQAFCDPQTQVYRGHGLSLTAHAPRTGRYDPSVPPEIIVVQLRVD